MLSAVAPSTPAVAGAAAEDKLYSLLSNARGSRGLSPLTLTGDLSGVARRHSERMAQENLLFHSPCLFCKISVGNALAENVGFGGTVRQIHRMMMGSAGHRANILGSFNQVGVGVVKRGGRFWVTEIFAA